MARKQQTPPKRGLRGCLTSGAWSAMMLLRTAIVIEFSHCRAKQQAARAKMANPPFTILSAVKAHVVMGSQGARTPEQPELLAALYSRGDQNRVSGYVGFESASQGRGPMRTIAQQQGNQISQQRRHGVSPRLSLDELCLKKGCSN